MSKLVYVNELIVDCRLRGIYCQIRHQKYQKAKDLISQMIMYLKNIDVNIEKELYNEIIEEFYHMSVEMAFKKYNNVHDRVRNLHYKIRYNY